MNEEADEFPVHLVPFLQLDELTESSSFDRLALVWHRLERMNIHGAANTLVTDSNHPICFQPDNLNSVEGDWVGQRLLNGELGSLRIYASSPCLPLKTAPVNLLSEIRSRHRLELSLANLRHRL